MCRRSSGMLVMVLASGAMAQDGVETPTQRVERYMADRGLNAVLSSHLLQRARAAEGVERTELALRVSRLQGELFERATTPEEEARWEAQTQKLLALVPEAESGELRVKMARVRYYRVERTAEQHVLRLAADDEVVRARSELRSLAQVFNEVGLRAMRQIDLIDRKLETAKDDDARMLRDEIGRARSLHASAMYFAGWSSLYAAMLSVEGGERDGKLAEDALVQFGYVLNAPTGRAALVDRVGEERMKSDYAARAALACAVAEAIRGRDDTAARWLDAVESTAGVPSEILGQVWPRRMVVLAWTRRWADLEYLVNRRRAVRDGVAAKQLSTAEARLLAVLGMEAQRDAKLPDAKRQQARALADAGIADLVAAGEVRHVTDLVSRYRELTLPGSVETGGGGFLLAYIRGSQLYEKARSSHGAAQGAKADEPTTDAGTANMYRDASAALVRSIASADSDRFGGEIPNASLMAGMALYFAGDLAPAAERLERVFVDHPGTKQAVDGLWMAVLSTDRLVQQGRADQRERLARLGTLFLKTYPTSERAVKLLVSRAGAAAATPEQAAELLLAIGPESPLFEQARRQAANVLYQMYRGAPAEARGRVAERFLPVAEDALKAERRAAAAADAASSAEAIGRVVLRGRQILDAALTLEPPDVARAEATLQLVESLMADSSSAKGSEPELVYRRVQLALAKGQDAEARAAADRLRALGGPFAERMDRLMFTRALSQAGAASADAAVHREVVVCGRRIIDGLTPGKAEDAKNAGVLDAVARSAWVLWRGGDAAMGAVAMEFDARLALLEAPPAGSLSRHAAMLEAAGKPEAALEQWRRLLAGLDPRGVAWMEARYESLRLLAASDPARAREVMAQFRALRPDYGPEPFGPKLRELDKALGVGAAGGGGAP